MPPGTKPSRSVDCLLIIYNLLSISNKPDARRNTSTQPHAIKQVGCPAHFPVYDGLKDSECKGDVP